MKNHVSYFVPAVTAAVFALLGLFCWYTGPNKHALMLQYRHLIEEEKKSQREIVKKDFGSCEKCKKPLRSVQGKFGEFISCSGYPECKYIKRQKASFVCPQCSGAIEKRVWSGGTLWGCSNYPECRFAIFSEIEDRPCTNCNASLYMIKTVGEDGAISLKCPNSDCISILVKLSKN